MDVYRNMIVPDAFVPLARGLSAGLSPVGGAQMYETGLSEDGTWPPTHWISSGFIALEYAELMPWYEWIPDFSGHLVTYARATISPGQPELVAQLAEQAGQPVPLAQIQALFDAADITTEDPLVAMARLGVQIVYPPEVQI